MVTISLPERLQIILKMVLEIKTLKTLENDSGVFVYD
jgi:hypothetical protein